MIPARYPITIYQGDHFDLIFRVKTGDGSFLNLTGMVPVAQIRPTADSPDILAQFTAVLGDQVVAPGSVILSLTPMQTAVLPAPGGVWDVQLQNSIRTVVNTYLAGPVTVIEQVTR